MGLSREKTHFDGNLDGSCVGFPMYTRQENRGSNPQTTNWGIPDLLLVSLLEEAINSVRQDSSFPHYLLSTSKVFGSVFFLNFAPTEGHFEWAGRVGGGGGGRG